MGSITELFGPSQDVTLSIGTTAATGDVVVPTVIISVVMFPDFSRGWSQSQPRSLLTPTMALAGFIHDLHFLTASP